MKTQFSQRDVRDPRRLASALEENFKAVEEQLPENVAETITGMIKATAGKVSKAVAGDDYLAPPVALPGADESGVLIIDDKGVVSVATAGTDYVTPDNALSPPDPLPGEGKSGVMLIDDAGVVTADDEGITTDGDVVVTVEEGQTLTIQVKNGLVTKLTVTGDT